VHAARDLDLSPVDRHHAQWSQHLELHPAHLDPARGYEPSPRLTRFGTRGLEIAPGQGDVTDRRRCPVDAPRSVLGVAGDEGPVVLQPSSIVRRPTTAILLR
jgi:hypothetical protein